MEGSRSSGSSSYRVPGLNYTVNASFNHSTGVGSGTQSANVKIHPLPFDVIMNDDSGIPDKFVPGSDDFRYYMQSSMDHDYSHCIIAIRTKILMRLK